MARTRKREVKEIWKVKEKPVADKHMYICYRLKDESKPDEEINRVYKGGLWTYEKEARDLAKRWNESGKI